MQIDLLQREQSTSTSVHGADFYARLLGDQYPRLGVRSGRFIADSLLQDDFALGYFTGYCDLLCQVAEHGKDSDPRAYLAVVRSIVGEQHDDDVIAASIVAVKARATRPEFVRGVIVGQQELCDTVRSHGLERPVGLRAHLSD